MKVRSRAILPGSGRPEHQTTGPLPQPSATIHPARDDLVVALRRRTPVDRNAHDRDTVSFRRSFFNTHRRLHSLTCWITPFTTTGFDSTACIISINPGPRLQPVRCSDAEYSLAVRYFGDGVRFIRNRPVG